ncbi:MAG: Fe-S oxidoreductase, partial [Chloroflexi bacterium]|nr:Fe-S oxidoreductase [Chloroflexota bacterium]
MTQQKKSGAPAKNKLAIDTPEFWDPQALLKEEQRQFDVCHSCRLCWNFCPAFPALFEKTDPVDGDTKKLSREAFRPVEDSCYQCKLCYIRCPYTEPHEYDLDVPRLLLRAQAVRAREEGLSRAERLLANTDSLFSLARATAPLSNVQPAPVRFVMEKTLGIDRRATLPKFHRQTFFEWFRSTGEKLYRGLPPDAPKVVLFYTCYVNYNDPAVGIACAKVLAHNGIRGAAPKQQCCGMPYLDAGAPDLAKKKLSANVKVLAEAVRQGGDIVTPGPSCSLTLTQEYPQLDASADTKLVSEHTYDISEYLWKLKVENRLKRDFKKPMGKVAYHAPCHLRQQFVGNKGGNLMELIPDTEVEQIERCSHHDGTWGI